jgi:hypothetical protein
MRRPSRGHCWSVPIRPTPFATLEGRSTQRHHGVDSVPGENSGQVAILSSQPLLKHGVALFQKRSFLRHHNDPVRILPFPLGPSSALPSVTPNLILNVSPELKPYIFTTSPNWTDIVEAADRIRQKLGISRSAWIDACQTMGRYQAATAIAVIAAKRETIRARNDELHLSNSLWGLARRERHN